MTPEQQAVQAGHVVAKFVKDNPDSDWTNGTLIYLRVKDAPSFGLWNSIIKCMYGKGAPAKPIYGSYIDPDIHGHDPTAMYVYGGACGHLLRDLPLMRFPRMEDW